MEKEILLKQGWLFKFEWNNVLKFEKGDVWKDDGQGAFLEVDVINKTIKITTTDKGHNMDGPNYSVKFNGNCNDMETFKKICDMINFKL